MLWAVDTLTSVSLDEMYRQKMATLMQALWQSCMRKFIFY